jgi:endonuclease YncB( thermonuclease family)
LIKRYALLFAILLAGLIISNAYIFTSFSVKDSREKVTISRIVDGDTLKLSDGRTVRLLNINSPEKGTRGANLSAEFLRKFENKTIDIDITGTDKYQRILARIYAPDYLNLAIVEQGLASKFLVQESELSDFAKAEAYAIENSLGIWKKSEYSNCFTISIDAEGEEAAINNACPEINLKNWLLKDESRKIYKFTNISFEKITLHSGSGTSNSTDLFWGEETVWNNDRDSAYLFDSEGGLAGYETYGY